MEQLDLIHLLDREEEEKKLIDVLNKKKINTFLNFIENRLEKR